MQQASVIGVTGIFCVEFPIAVDILALVADYFDWSIKDPPNARYHHRTEKLLKCRNAIRKSREYHSVEDTRTQGLETMVF